MRGRKPRKGRRWGNLTPTHCMPVHGRPQVTLGPPCVGAKAHPWYTLAPWMALQRSKNRGVKEIKGGKGRERKRSLRATYKTQLELGGMPERI